MAFLLKEVVPWGRTLNEYMKMFDLSKKDIVTKSIISFGDGPASFNAEALEMGGSVLSLDPIYNFSAEEIRKRIAEVSNTVMEQTAKNKERYNWNGSIKNLDELKSVRMSAMNIFLSDFEEGKAEGRYVAHSLPEKTSFKDNSFDIGLSSHFLLMYTQLGYDFHINSIDEMLRICREIRIFPILDLSGNKTGLAKKIFEHYSRKYTVSVVKTEYEFQKGGNEMLKIIK